MHNYEFTLYVHGVVGQIIFEWSGSFCSSLEYLGVHGRDLRKFVESFKDAIKTLSQMFFCPVDELE